MRVRIRDRKLERVADLKNFRQAGYFGLLARDGSGRFTAFASRHGRPGNLHSGLGSALAVPT
jgi:hypothetical protein